MFLVTSCFSFSAIKYQCEDSFQGGTWALVRRVKSGSKWHRATDDLRGVDVYGTYGTATSDSSFSAAYSSWLTPNTEFLFITGKIFFCVIGEFKILRPNTIGCLFQVIGQSG
jgi:hypothetical protein